MPKFIIKGGKPLRGTVKVSGSKNAALPLLAATLLTDKPCVLKNVPDISDIHLLLEIMQSIGTEFEYANGTLNIQTKKLKSTKIPQKLAAKMRASILLLGPLLARAGTAQLPFPGGCVIGKRSTHAHEYALENIGFVNKSNANELKFSGKAREVAFNMSEMSVTATENAIMAAALTKGLTKIRMAAYEPHVVDLCSFVKKLGAKVEGVGTHTLKITGVAKPKGVTHTVTTDYLEVGTFAVAGLITGGQVRVEGVVPKQLDSFFQKLEEIGAKFEVGADYIEVFPTKKFTPTKLQTAVFPGFPTDLQAPFGVLLTQASGKSRIFETLFEGRLAYLNELEKMGVVMEMLNPHQAIIVGKTRLKAAKMTSCDLRAGAAVVLAALAAKGTSEIYDIQYIDRGYDRFAEKLTALGASIERVE